MSRKMPRAKLPTFRADSMMETNFSMADSVLLPFLKPYCFGDSEASSLMSRWRFHRMRRSISFSVHEERDMILYDFAVW